MVSLVRGAVLGLDI